MAGVYKAAVDQGFGPTAKAAMDKEAQAMGAVRFARLPGTIIMGANPTTFATLVTALQAHIHSPASPARWDGGGRGGDGYSYLDGLLTSGECAMFARSLLTLARAPKPYGLGLAGVDFLSYSGQYKEGFVSNHPAMGVMGLLPNVAGQNLYMWDSHKVVRYGGVLYDVMYRTTYANKEAMTVCDVMPDPITEGTDTYYPVETVGVTQGAFYKQDAARAWHGPSRHMPF